MIRYTCNKCGRKIDIDPHHIPSFCPYCRNPLSHHAIYAEISRIEQEKTTYQHYTSYTENIHKQDKRQTKLLIIICLISFLFLLGSIIFAIIMSLPTDEDHIKNGEIKITASSDEFKGQNYKHVYDTFVNIGFENIKLEANPDIVLGIFVKEGEIESISINGDTSFTEGDWYPKDAIIVIKYHTKKQ